MSTQLGEYLDKLNVNKTKISDLTDLKRQRVSDLCNKINAKPTPIEFYKIVLTAILLKNLPEEEFNNAINEVFSDRQRVDFLKEFDDLSPDVRFIQKHCLTQKKVESEIAMSEGKISRLGSKDVKEVLAIELICFIEGLRFDVLQTFKEIFGKINLTKNTNI